MSSTISQILADSPNPIDVEAAVLRLPDLHRHVVTKTGRIELQSKDGATCVLISKSELDSLEHALEILSDTSEVRGVRQQLERLASFGIHA